jgi:hypothetical protein
MPRIRTIKPEFWDSPGTARASLRGRLFFIAMWNWADDWGIGTANAKQLVGFAFPNDDDVTAADFPRLATEVADCYDVQWYEVDNRPYFAIPSWDQHQKNERRASKRNPGPDQGFSIAAEMRGDSVRTDGKTPIGTGEQGNRGTVFYVGNRCRDSATRNRPPVQPPGRPHRSERVTPTRAGEEMARRRPSPHRQGRENTGPDRIRYPVVAGGRVLALQHPLDAEAPGEVRAVAARRDQAKTRPTAAAIESGSQRRRV